jgi:hypothetical protein
MDLNLALNTWCLGIILPLLLLLAQPKKTMDLYLALNTWCLGIILQLSVLDHNPSSHPNPAKLT